MDDYRPSLVAEYDDIVRNTAVLTTGLEAGKCYTQYVTDCACHAEIWVTIKLRSLIK